MTLDEDIQEATSPATAANPGSVTGDGEETDAAGNRVLDQDEIDSLLGFDGYEGHQGLSLPH